MQAPVGLSIVLGKVFPIEVVARTAHRYTDNYFVEINDDSGVIRVGLMPRIEDAPTDGIEHRFRNDLLDDLLREKVRTQTAELHTVLAEAALRQARPRATG
jgi:His-Xaa-Ser system protein HxsD